MWCSSRIISGTIAFLAYVNEIHRCSNKLRFYLFADNNNILYADKNLILRQVRVDRLQIIVVAQKYIYVSQLFISRMPKMRAIPQLVSAPLNPIAMQNILGGATHRVSTVADNTYK